MADPSVPPTNLTAEPIPSNRQFGLVFVIFFALFGAVSLWRNGNWYPGLFGASGLVALVTLAMPGVLTPFNRWWMKLSALLHRIVSPIMLGVMYFLILTPMALMMRLAGRDEMRRRFDRAADSYWVPRVPPGPAPGSLDRPF